jgi:hypothetical protein
MALRKLAPLDPDQPKDCVRGNCPAVYFDEEEGLVIVQGATRTDLITPEGETAVAIPRRMLHQAAQADRQ